MSVRTYLVAGMLAVGAVLVVRAESPTQSPVAAPAKAYHSKPHPWSSDEILAAREQGAWRGRVTLERSSNGHYYSYARLGEARIKVVIDTGATIVALTGDDARKAGMTWNAAEVKVVARGASGDVHGVVRDIPRLEVGGIAATNVDAVIIPEGLDVSLLGQSYLKHVRKVEIEGATMVLSNM